MTFILVSILSYLVGAVPFAYVMTKIITGKDVRSYGSGNVGATNAARLLGFKYGILVAVLDVLKGIIAVSLAGLILPDAAPTYYLLIAALLVIVGHNWSVFLKFSGGKGVATTFGVIIRLYPLVFLIFILLWILVVLITRYVSLASVISAALIPIVVYFRTSDIYHFLFTFIFGLLIIIRHTSNIKRLINGNESKINWPSGIKKGDM